MKPKFDCVSAAVKGYLTRRLLKTHKVQEIIKTINVSIVYIYLYHLFSRNIFFFFVLVWSKTTLTIGLAKDAKIFIM